MSDKCNNHVRTDRRFSTRQEEGGACACVLAPTLLHSQFDYTDQRETKQNLRSVGRRRWFPVIRSPSSDPPKAHKKDPDSPARGRERKERTNGREWRRKEAKGNRRTRTRTDGRRRVRSDARSLVRLADLRLRPFFRFLPHVKAALALTELERGKEGRKEGGKNRRDRVKDSL